MADSDRDIDDQPIRFEVRAVDSGGAEHIVGWTNDPAGGRLLKMAAKHMEISEVRIVALKSALGSPPSPQPTR